MRVPLEWLLEYCDPGLSVTAIEERLTMTGTKVEAIHHHGVQELDRFVVARVLEVEAHPGADRLRVCAVDIGGGASSAATIVCGAPNVAAGQTVGVALPGAVMPDGTKLNAAKLRGVASEGMILAEDELEIGIDHQGIAVLDQLAGNGALPPEVDLTPGAPLAQALPIATEVIELEVTPNRPDCLGIYGVARELHAATGAPLASPSWAGEVDLVGDGGGEEGDERFGGLGGGRLEGDERFGGLGGGRLEGDERLGRLGGDRLEGLSRDRLEGLEVRVECPELCPRFTATVFDGVTVGPSPPWLKARLTAAGQRPINNVVDITNYVMLATGQPTHAFDLERVAGGALTVRTAAAGEAILTLDGQERTLEEGMIVIEDAQGPTSLAGVMGGGRSEVHEHTATVAIEAASWDGPTIHRTSWALGLRSEASSRFEKGLAPEQCAGAQVLARALMVELCGATPRPGRIDVCQPLSAPATITLRSSRVQSILGVSVSLERQQEILTALGFVVAAAPTPPEGGPEGPGGGPREPGGFPGDPVAAGGELKVTVPPLRRADVTREADLIEEVARIDGLERLPATLPARRGAYGMLSDTQRLGRRTTDALVGRGLNEVVGWTFTSPELADGLRLAAEHPLRAQAVKLENPLSEEQAVLRPALIGSLLDVASRNRSRGASEIAIFEVGTVFAASDAAEQTGVAERRSLGVLLAGSIGPPTWRDSDTPKADFFAAKGILQAVADSLGVQLQCIREDRPERLPFLHPGRCAQVISGRVQLGWIGEVHPLVVERWGLGDAALDGAPAAHCAALELDLGLVLEIAVAARAGRSYTDLISYPALRMDLAVTLPEHVPAAEAIDTVRSSAGPLLDSAGVFDVYTGPQVSAGRRSLALSLSFRAPDRTLSEGDIDPLRAKILGALSKIGGELRV